MKVVYIVLEIYSLHEIGEIITQFNQVYETEHKLKAMAYMENFLMSVKGRRCCLIEEYELID